MLAPKDQLTELVRTLESQQYIFVTDPLLITEQLQFDNSAPLKKLHRRAARIDSNQHLIQILAKIEGRIKGMMILMSVVWCVSGFLGLFTLLQSNVVNFFYVLVCLLGFHSVMLAGWLLLTLMQHRKAPSSWFASMVSPSHLITGKDDVTLAAVDLYEKQLQHSGMRWYLGRFSHQLWLATLTGMLLAMIFLLVVRQYSFSWESTLLSDNALISLTHILSWLPSMVGFDVPDNAAIVQSRSVTDALPLSVARQWAGLLIGSLLVYGIVPRALAWAFCAWRFRHKKMRIDLKHPYYQKIIQFWQRQVVDQDDFKPAPAPVAPKASVYAGHKVVALLDYPSDIVSWWQASTDPQMDADNRHHHLENHIKNFGILDERDDMTRLLTYLDSHSAQVILGIHSNALPDRGTLRKLDQIVHHATQGLVVQLLQHDNVNVEVGRYQQWQTALAARKIGLIDHLN